MITDPNIDPNVGKDFIEHYGAKGMRWGVRRSREERARASGKKEEKDEDKKPKTVVGKTKTGGKSVSEMSDAQLKRVNNRLNMEQQYAKMTDPGPSATQKVLGASSRFVTQAARNVAMTQVTNAANAEASKRIAMLMAKRAGKLATTGA